MTVERWRLPPEVRSQCLGGMMSIDGRGETVPLVVLLVLSLKGASLWMIFCFLGAIDAKREAF